MIVQLLSSSNAKPFTNCIKIIVCVLFLWKYIVFTPDNNNQYEHMWFARDIRHCHLPHIYVCIFSLFSARQAVQCTSICDEHFILIFIQSVEYYNNNVQPHSTPITHSRMCRKRKTILYPYMNKCFSLVMLFNVHCSQRRPFAENGFSRAIFYIYFCRIFRVNNKFFFHYVEHSTSIYGFLIFRFLSFICSFWYNSRATFVAQLSSI